LLALVLKLTLAPGLVATATWVGRRLGHRAGGLVGGLPVIAAPIVLIYTVEQGNGFAREAATAGALGLVAPVLFCLVYAWCARRAGYIAAVAGGWLAFGCATAVLSFVEPPLIVNVIVALLAIAAGSWLLARAVAGPAEPAVTSDLLLWRLVLTAALVLAVTAAAHGLSAHLAGLLSTFPVFTPVVAAFTHARAGAGAAIEMLSGLVPALVCFLAFYATLAATISPLGAVAAFGVATVAALALWAGLVAAVSLSASRARPSPARGR
jgi:hypothetical protein